MSTPTRKSLIEKVTLSTRPGRLHPKALALLDVLIGMAIFALIAVIAVVALGQFRAKAYLTGAMEDARSLALVIEGSNTNNGVLPQTADIAQDATTGDVTWSGEKLHRLTQGNTLTYAYTPALPDGTPAGFTVCIEHEDDGDYVAGDGTVDASALYSSLENGIVDSAEGATSVC